MANATPHISDSNIIELYFARDEQAIGLTAERYGSYCFTVADNILKNIQDAEECVNDTYLRTWNTIPPTRPASLKHYLAKITRNLALSRWRQNHADCRGGGQISMALDEMEEFLADTREPASEADRAALSDCLNRFLRGLSRRDCDIFLRRYFYMEDTDTIARRHGMKTANVLLILSRTRSRLRTYLEKEGFSV